MDKKLYNLTNPQKSILLTEEYYKGTNINNICGTAIIENELDFDLLKKAISIFVENHDSFHFRLVMDNNEIKQYVDDIENYDAEIIDINSKEEIANIENDLINHVFDIYNGDLFCAKIFRLKDKTGGFIVNVHHLFGDSWTLGIVANDIVRIYSCLLNGEEVTKNEDFSYVDYIYSEKEYLSSDKFKKDKDYWNSIYSTIPEQASIPGSISNSKDDFSCKAERSVFNIDTTLMDKINEFCKLNRVSVFNFFMAVYAIYIGRVSNLDDFVIGTPILNRTNFKEKNTTGMFINTAPLRISVDDSLDFKSFVTNIAKDSLGMLRHQKYYYQNILEDLRKDNPNLPNLYNVLISYQVTTANAEKGLTYNTRWSFNGNIADDMDIHLYDLNASGSIDVSYDYKINKYSEFDVSSMHNRILYMIRQIMDNTNISINSIDILTPKEKETISNFNNTYLEYPKDKNIIQLFEEQAKNNPNQIALVFKDKKITYKDLNEQANKLAHHLHSLGIRKHSIISIYMDKNIEFIISILAIQKLGCAYLPLHPEYPIDRVRYIVTDSKSALLITNQTIDIDVQQLNINAVDLNKMPNSNINISFSIDSLAYVIYTSGSTGNPKGVMLTHKNLVNFIYSFNNVFENGFSNNDNCLSLTNISFDVSVCEIFTPLVLGATLVLYPENTLTDISLLYDILVKNNITFLYLPPNILDDVYNYITAKNSPIYINKLLVGVEPIKCSTLNSFYNLNENIEIINGYGPTETTICCTFYKYHFNKDLSGIVPIGKPLNNNKIYILSKSHTLQPIGIPGEIYVSGNNVANGYLNNPGLTQNSFFSSILDNNLPTYKTGDLAYWNKDGSITFIGRIDSQIKLNGHRIELGEINNVIKNIDGVINAVTVIRTINNTKHLCSYIVSDLEINYVKNTLKSLLPYYMIPTYIEKMDKLPLTPNGKIDTQKLPDINTTLNTKKVAPNTNTERELFSIWSILFKNDNFGINDNFFDLGGDSLHVIRLSAELNNRLQVEVSMKDIINNPTIYELAKFIDNSDLSGTSNKYLITSANDAYSYPLSTAQQRIYYSCKKMGNDNLVYNVPGGLLIDGILDKEKISSSFNNLVNLHNSFRTCFRIIDGEPRQIILDNIDFNINFYNDNEINLTSLVNSFCKPFDLENAPLLRVSVYYLDKKKTLILLDSHHIIMDGTSLNIFIKDFCKLYNGIKITKSTLNYVDYTVWEANYLISAELKPLEDYWVNKFNNYDTIKLNLPYDFPMPVSPSYEGNTVNGYISTDLFNKLENISKNAGVSNYMLFLSAFYVLLYKYTSQDDIIVGSPIAGRFSADLSDIIGMFVNNLTLPAHIDSTKTFNDFLQYVKELVVSAMDHQPYPYDLLINKLNLNGSDLFDVMFTYQNTDQTNETINGHNFDIIRANANISKFNLSLEILPYAHTINLEYRTDLFKEETINRMLTHYINLLNIIANNIECKIADLSILSKEEENQLLYEFNDTKISYPLNKTIADLFEEQVEKTPNNTAIVFENTKLTYKELNEKANQLARHLISNGITSNSIIGIMLPRSVEVLIAMIATLKIGACYIPIDPTLPESRIHYMLNNSECNTLLTFGNVVNNINIKHVINIKLDNFTIYTGNSTNLNLNIDTEQPSYMIYTSGSTGTPKGVVLKHKSLTNLACYLNNTVDFLKHEYSNIAIASITTISFDIFIFETLVCLQRGLKVVMANEAEQNTPHLLDDLIKKNNVKAIQMTPSRMHIFINNKNIMPNLCNLDYVVLAGEPLPKELLNSILELGNIKVYNGYGPSETTVFSSFTDVTNYNKITIGRPIDNTKFYIMDKDMNLCPHGFPGELYIGGDGVAIGYINNKTITEERFIISPFDNSTIYKTGDLVKYLNNGELHYIGRIDNQIKIRGLRIELDEIEKCILRYPNIDKCIIDATKDSNERQFIVAYLTVTDRISINKLREFLRNILPKYMVPSYFIILDEIPYLNNGKINKKALPEPELKNNFSDKEYIAPQNKLEQQIADIFQDLLSISPIGIDDNFFELGGDSLLAINLQIKLLKINDNITYSDIFMYPTIRDLANKITSEDKCSVEGSISENIKNFETILNKTTTLPTNFNYNSLGNILISGTTGFLGAHVLDAFLRYETGTAYCLVRPEPGMTLEHKFIKKLHFYFGTKYDDLLGNRIVIVNSDICKDNLGLFTNQINELAQSVSCVINCAAKVSHYGNYADFKKINVTGTQNLIDFCMKYNKRFYHISTLSVSGNGLVDQAYIKQDFEKEVLFTENNFYINQCLDNVYVRSKFEAEKLTLEAILDGLDGYIFRVGNLMNRYSDGHFQPNVEENAFISRLLSFFAIGCIPDYILSGYMEFTPIDICAEAIVKIMQYSNQENRIFHLFNHNHVDVSDFISVVQNYKKINVVSNDEFIAKIDALLQKDTSAKIVSGIIKDFDDNKHLIYKTNIKLKSDFTIDFLNKTGFNWPIVDSVYLKKFLDYFHSLNYITKEEN